MLKGIAFALAACFVWGLIFVIPGFMGSFSPFEVALGRYSFYGLISSILFLNLRRKGSCSYPRKIWLQALLFSFASTFFYYICLVLGLRYSTPAISALVLGVSPIAIAFYGNLRKKELDFSRLILPSLFILIGLIIINAPHLHMHETPANYLLGLFCSFLSLAAWSWYVVANSEFFKKYPDVQSCDWSTMIGVSTIFWVILCSTVTHLFFPTEFALEKYTFDNDSFSCFLIGSCILGLVCSWVGAYCWNRANHYLPVTLAGQLTIFETIFGVVFVYLVEQRMPPLMELVGMSCLIGAVLYGIHVTSRSHVAA